MSPFDSTAFEEPLEEERPRSIEIPERDFTLTMPPKETNGSTTNGGGGSVSNGNGSSTRPYAYTRSSSGFGTFLNYANSPTTERARPATPAYSATRSTVFEGTTVSESPPPSNSTSSNSFFPPPSTSTTTAATSGTNSKASNLLSKLEIPEAPMVALTGPTPETEKPRPKGRGTLELERVLGLWAAKTPTSSFPSLSSIGPSPSSTSTSSTPSNAQPLFAQSSISLEPESFVPTTSTASSHSAPPEGNNNSTATNSYSSIASGFPEFPAPSSSSNTFSPTRDRSSGDSLAPPSFLPRRRRSKSDTDVMRVDSLGFPHSNLPVGPFVDPPPIVSNQPTFASSVAPPSPINGGGFQPQQQQLAMDPNDTWRSPSPSSQPSPSFSTTNHLAALDLDLQKPLQQQQREFISRSSRPLGVHKAREGGGPGYRQAAFLDVPLVDGSGSDNNNPRRRSRSQGAGHRSSKSDDLSHLLPTLQQSQQPQPSQVTTTSVDGLLAPPPTNATTRHASPNSSHPPPAASPSPYPPSQAPSPYAHQQASPYPQQSHNFGGGQYQPQHLPPPPPQTHSPQYLSNQAALLASAALIAFNPTDPAHAAAAAAGYLPPSYPSSSSSSNGYPHHPQYPLQQQQPQQQYASPSQYPGQQSHLPPLPPPPHHAYHPHGSHSPSFGSTLPSLPLHHQHSQQQNGQSSTTGMNQSLPPRTAPYLYHSPSGMLPSPPTTSTGSLDQIGGNGNGNGSVKSSTSTGRTVRKSRIKVEKSNGNGGEGEDEEMVDYNEEDEEGDEMEDELEEDEDEEEDGGKKSKSKGKGGGGRNIGKGSKKKIGTTSNNAGSSITSNGVSKPRSKRQNSSTPNPNGTNTAVGDDGGFSEQSKTTQATIEAAKRRRNANAVAKFVCELCGETFTRRYNLRGHQRAHNGEKPYKCSHEGCDKAFARAHDCKRHELLHLGVRKYHCSPCKRDFVRLDALHRHHRSEVGQACVKQLESEGYVFEENGAVVQS